MNKIDRVVIFGATSAIAQQVARQLARSGSSIYCIGRNAESLSAIIADLQVRGAGNQIIDGEVADLTDCSQHQKLVSNAVKSLGGMDAALIAHGSLPDQHACERDVSLALRAIETNAISAVSLLSVLANSFESQGYGVIAGIGSVAGDRGRQSNYVYGASKAMVAAFMQGMRNRLYKSGVAVVTIKPGFVDTPMTSSFEKGGPLWTTPDKVATGIIDAMIKGKDIAYLPGFWRLIMFVIKHIPESIFKRMSL